MKCINCECVNMDNALFCKRCGIRLRDFEPVQECDDVPVKSNLPYNIPLKVNMVDTSNEEDTIPAILSVHQICDAVLKVVMDDNMKVEDSNQNLMEEYCIKFV